MIPAKSSIMATNAPRQDDKNPLKKFILHDLSSKVHNTDSNKKVCLCALKQHERNRFSFVRHEYGRQKKKSGRRT